MMKEIFLIKLHYLKNGLQQFGIHVEHFDTQEAAISAMLRRKVQQQDMPVAVLCEFTTTGTYKELIEFSRISSQKVPVIIISKITTDLAKNDVFKSGAADFITYDTGVEKIAFRIKTLDDWQKQVTRKPITLNYNLPVGKRIFDIVVSLGLIIMLLPLLVAIGMIIKLTSRGPVFYSSPRVGTGYKVFPFYKFRSMRVNADKMLKDLKHLNHYKQSSINAEIHFNKDSSALIGDEGYVSEEQHRLKQEEENRQAFVKFKNDPRITKIGRFIRKTSIDELPQLFNVLLGHMSIVGNRPLPLYEAEKLTSDEWTMRFMAPAGITGLWQVTERGKASTSEDSRKMLDIQYAQKYSMWMDIKILLKTPLAAIQQEKV